MAKKKKTQKRKSSRSHEKIRAKKAVPQIPREEAKRELKISAIEEGTVQDKVPSNATFKIV